MIMTSMLRAARRPLVFVFLVAALVSACRSEDVKELSVTEAEAGLRSSPTFTTRPGSASGRSLVQIVSIRRIGRSSTEVEFTWRDTAPAAGQAEAPVRTSMALFRLRGETPTWALSSLYKVN